jgi:hypothetical protein
MKNIKQLQSIVNEISNKLDKIDTPEKLRQAEIIVEQIEKTQLVEIVKEALVQRYIKDTESTIKDFLKI